MESKVIVKFPAGRKVLGELNGFSVMTDQSVAQGGEGSAPNPYELFLLSLATCAGYFAKQFCLEREIDTENMQITQVNTHNDAGKLVNVLLEITPPKDFPKKYYSALIKSVESCKIKQVLANPPQLEVELKEAE